MLTVNDDVVVVERRLAAGGLVCPCGGVLSGWGWARPRRLRGSGRPLLVRPRRTRCLSCSATHVLLPARMLVRRADAAEVVGRALTAKAAGRGARPIAAALRRPLSTVRGWLRRFADRAELLRGWFVDLLVAVAADPQVPDAAGSSFADAVTVIGAAAMAVVGRFGIVAVTLWRVASVALQGGLLSVQPPAKWINTSSPWQQAM